MNNVQNTMHVENPTRLKRKRGIINYQLSIIHLLLLCMPVALFAQVPDTVQQGTVPEVTIQFTKPTVQQSANVTTMSMPQIRAQQGNGSVNNLLELMPSVVVTSESGNGLGATYMFIRGIDQTRINTTLNGVTINNAESQGSWLVNLPDMGTYIENVSVQSGANTSDGSTSYGARVDFVTRDIPLKPFAEARTAYGSFNNPTSAATATSTSPGCASTRASLRHNSTFITSRRTKTTENCVFTCSMALNTPVSHGTAFLTTVLPLTAPTTPVANITMTTACVTTTKIPTTTTPRLSTS